MTKTATYTSLGVSATILALGAFALVSAAEAYRGEPGTPGPDCTPERQAMVEDAFANHANWLEWMDGKGRVTEKVTNEDFATFAQAREAARAGNLEEAKQLRESLGLGVGQQKGEGVGAGNQHQQSGKHAYKRGL